MDQWDAIDPVDSGEKLQDLESEGGLSSLAEVCRVNHDVATRM